MRQNEISAFDRWLPWITCALILLVYVFDLPQTVQTGDTGELVANAYRFQVSHPSGYPLFTLLYGAFTHIFAIGSVFFRAGLCTSLLAISSLLLLIFSFDDRRLASVVALNIAFSRLFWRYAVLPDVFALHCFLVALFIFGARRVDKRKGQLISMLAFGLGVANHLTIVFLAPAVVVVLLENRKSAWRAITGSCAVAMICYGSLLFFHPQSPFSWGEIRSVADVGRHLLREDYAINTPPSPMLRSPPYRGDQLASMNDGVPGEKFGEKFLDQIETGWVHLIHEPGGPQFTTYAKFFFVNMAADFAAIFGILVVLLWIAVITPSVSRLTGALLISLGLYLYFLFALLRIPLTALGTTVSERFFLFAHFIVAALLLLVWPNVEEHFNRLKIGFIGVVLISGLLNFAKYHQINDFSKNTIVEDYARNFLTIAEQQSAGQAALILVRTDTTYFAMRYVQQIQERGANAWVIMPSLLLNEWYRKKVKRVFADFRLTVKPLGSHYSFSLENDLLKPNLGHFAFFTEDSFNNTDDFRVTFMAAGRRIENGKGIGFAAETTDLLTLRSNPESLRLPIHTFDEPMQLYSMYSYYYLARAKAAAQNENRFEVVQNLTKAIGIVPYCLPAMENLCSFQSGLRLDDCQETVQRIRTVHFDYFSKL